MELTQQPTLNAALSRPTTPPYAAPALVRYGRVRELTQGGTGSPVESGNCNINHSRASECPTSDRRLKENIVRIGDPPLGIGLYLFDYTDQHKQAAGPSSYSRQFGVMADEVERVMPSAVVTGSNGFKAVRYHMLGIDR